MTEQWFLLQSALRETMAVIAEEVAPVRWLILFSYKILDFILWIQSRVVR